MWPNFNVVQLPCLWQETTSRKLLDMQCSEPEHTTKTASLLQRRMRFRLKSDSINHSLKLMPRLFIDHFSIALILTVLIASILPCAGITAVIFQELTYAAVGLLFFLHGAKLSRSALLAGLFHWRLHGAVLLTTFLAFPLLGLLLKPLLSPLLTPVLYAGVLFLCVLPSTVQSSIAFTSMAGGNVAAAITSASLSNVLGIALTPLWVGLLFKAQSHNGHISQLLLPIFKQLLLPFLIGQLLRPWIGNWIDQHRHTLKWVDQGSILLVVYTAFSAAVIQHLWEQTSITALAGLVLVCAILLLLILACTYGAGRYFKFSRADQITLLFCGSKKSLASGVPLASLLFTTSQVGLMVLPIMIFHSLQLLVCALLAQQLAARPAHKGQD